MATGMSVRSVRAERIILRRAAEGAAILLLFTAMVSARMIAVISAGALVGLLVYAWMVRRDPERRRHAVTFVAVACAAAVIAGGVAALTVWAAR